MLPIHEQFYSFQGEGVHIGRAAYFIRTFGCPVHCPWCDSAGTWHPDYIPEKVHRFDVATLVQAVNETNAEFVVVTGGEPTVHNLSPLVDALHEVGLKAHLETSGAFPIKGDFDWITLSPKRWKLPLKENLRKANEFKVIVDSPYSIREYDNLIQSANAKPPIWLHPEWSMREDAELLEAITQWIKEHGAPYRAGWQIHKPYAADSLDTRSEAAAPLGGSILKGY